MLSCLVPLYPFKQYVRRRPDFPSLTLIYSRQFNLFVDGYFFSSQAIVILRALISRSVGLYNG